MAAVGTARADVDPALVSTIQKIKPSDYPSANTVAVLAEQAVVYQSDGSFSNTFHSVQLVLTQSGKSEAASTSIYYTRDDEKVELIRAQVIKKDGSVVQVPKSDIQDTEQSGEMNIYDPNGRALKVNFANLAVGDAVDIQYKLSRLHPTRPGVFNDQFWFVSTEPLIKAQYLVDGPADKPLVAEIYHPERAPKIATTKTKVGDRIHYAWSVQNVPQLVPEAGMAMSNEVPALVLTTDPSWPRFSKWWAEVAEPKMKPTPELRAKAKELTKDKKTADEKIRALYDFVSADIRYRGLGVGPRTGYTPRDATDTMSSRWGVCRDVAILLAAMLRSEGFQAYPVLTNVGDPVLPKIAYDGFNHAIVAMPKPGGGWIYLDPTAKNNKELLPAYEAEQSALVSTLQGEPLGQIPAVDPKANLGHAKATSTLGADGTLHSKVVVETKGVFDLVLRSTAATMSADEQRQAIEQLVNAALPDAKLIHHDISSALAIWNPMTITIELEVPNAATKVGDRQLLRTLVTSGALGLVENVMPQVLGGLAQRKYMLDAHVTFQYDQDETVTLPAGIKIAALPNSAKMTNKVTTMEAECKQQNATTLVCHRSFALRSRFIEPTQYTQLRSVVSTLGRVARQPVILAGGK
ncbi:MAG TPA: DUF3857 domain-containing protein [Kofleriaceae bacterium]|nr:DUF3857 domain-containing protein [Kofleriaceae bacterium]